MMNICECGICGQECKNRFVQGHNSVGKKGPKNRSHTEKELAYYERLKESSKGEGNNFYGKRHSQGTVNLMSKSRLEYLKAHPEVIDDFKQRALGNTYHKDHLHSEESKELMRIASSGNQHALGHVCNEKSRKLMSDKRNQYYAAHGTSDETRHNLSIAKKGKPYHVTKKFLDAVKLSNQNIEKRKASGKKQRGKKLTFKAIQKRTLTRAVNGTLCGSDGAIAKRFLHSGWRKFPYVFSDGTIIKMRSSWEVLYAKFLDSQEIIWQYEPKSFKLSNGHRYFPDFFLPDLNEWHEVKGYLAPSAQEKMDLFKKEYPDLKFKLLMKSDLQALGIF